MTIVIPAEDEKLRALTRHDIASHREPNVRFRLGSLLGSGAMGIAYFGMREAADGRSPVVIKLLKPEYVVQAGETARLIVEKEAVALSRLNNRVPPTPFVVRMVDAGTVSVNFHNKTFELPWLALEYVHGGAEGTTLTERVAYSVEKTGYAFDPVRAAHAVDCIAKGVEAVHEVGVIHRDMTPNNVLCCGFGEEEIFKISDFGLARPIGLTATFGGIVVGTVGYAPPEQAALDDRRIGTWSDVFTFAVDIFFMLTGRSYFPTRSPSEALALVKSPNRPSILGSALLSPELRDQPAACTGVDLALKLATAARPEERPRTAQIFASMIVPWLKGGPRSRPVASRRLESVAPPPDHQPRPTTGWGWTVRHRPADEHVVRSVAWDGDGRCLAATSEGLQFWNGTSWLAAPTRDLPNPRGIRFVQRMSAGNWLVGGDEATLATYSADGVSEVVRGPAPDVSFSQASGDFDDLAVVVGESDGPPVLYALSSRRWLKPLPLDGVARVAALARVGDDSWLVGGRQQGRSWLSRTLSAADVARGALRHPTSPRPALGCGARRSRARCRDRKRRARRLRAGRQVEPFLPDRKAGSLGGGRRRRGSHLGQRRRTDLDARARRRAPDPHVARLCGVRPDRQPVCRRGYGHRDARRRRDCRRAPLGRHRSGLEHDARLEPLIATSTHLQ